MHWPRHLEMSIIMKILEVMFAIVCLVEAMAIASKWVGGPRLAIVLTVHCNFRDAVADLKFVKKFTGPKISG